MTGKLKDSSLLLELSFNFYHQELQDGLDYEIKQGITGKYHEMLDWYNSQLFGDNGDEGSTKQEENPMAGKDPNKAYHMMQLQLWKELEETERVSRMLVLLLTDELIILISPPLPL